VFFFICQTTYDDLHSSDESNNLRCHHYKCKRLVNLSLLWENTAGMLLLALALSIVPNNPSFLAQKAPHRHPTYHKVAQKRPGRKKLISGTDYVPLDELTLENAPFPVSHIMGTYILNKKFTSWAAGNAPKYYELPQASFTLTKPWLPCTLAVTPEEVQDTLVHYCIKLAQPLNGSDNKSCWIMVTEDGRGQHGTDETYFIATKFPPNDCMQKAQTNNFVPVSIDRPWPSTVDEFDKAARTAVPDDLYNHGMVTNWDNYKKNFYDSPSGALTTAWTHISTTTFVRYQGKDIQYTFVPNAGATYYAVYGYAAGADYYYHLRYWEIVSGVIRKIPS